MAKRSPVETKQVRLTSLQRDSRDYPLSFASA
jgi:hypothetical protein